VFLTCYPVVGIAAHYEKVTETRQIVPRAYP
jgi:hypothetical protein